MLAGSPPDKHHGERESPFPAECIIDATIANDRGALMSKNPQAPGPSAAPVKVTVWYDYI